MSSKMSKAVILGYHFLPTEEELIEILKTFLECKGQGKKFPVYPIAEKVVYGYNATPWEIFSQDDHWESTEKDCSKKGLIEVVFVFTQLSAMSTKKKSRTAGCGTWEGQTGIKEIKNRKGEIIGFRKMLSYRVNKGSESQQPDNACWRMHEYALSGVSVEEMKLKGIDIGNYVICKVTRDYSKCGILEKDQILGNKRMYEFAEENSMHQNKKSRILMESVNLEAQELGNNRYPTAAESYYQPAEMEAANYSYCVAEETLNYSYYQPTEPGVDYSYPPTVNYSYPTAAIEVAADHSYQPSETEVAVDYSYEHSLNYPYPTSAERSTVNDSYPTMPAEETVNYSYAQSPAEAALVYSYQTSAAEASSENDLDGFADALELDLEMIS